MSQGNNLDLEPELFQLLWLASLDGEQSAIASLWSLFSEELSAVRVIAHDPAGGFRPSANVVLPTDRDFQGVAWLRSLYGSTDLRCYDARITQDMTLGDQHSSPIQLDYVILCDTNIVSYCRKLWLGGTLPPKQAEVFRMVSEFLLRDHPGRADPGCFLHENFGLPASNSMAEALAGFYAWMDTPVEECTRRGVLAPRRPRETYVRRAEERLEVLRTSWVGKGFSRVRRASRFCYLAFLRATIEQWTTSRNTPVAEKLLKLLAFFDVKVSAIPTYEMLAALYWLEVAQRPTFFDPVQVNRSRDKLLHDLKGMAWDLVHLREMTLWAASGSPGRGRGADCCLTYFLTSDRRFAEFLPELQLRALLLRVDRPFYESAFFKEDLLSRFQRITDHRCDVFFTLEAKNRRQANQLPAGEPRERLLDQLIAECEDTLRQLPASGKA